MVRSAAGRAVGLLDTPPVMFADGSLGPGGPYDGIITLNPAHPLQFTRPVAAGNYDAQMFTEHEIDEVLGLGSHLNSPRPDLLEPQDLFSWASLNARNTGASGQRFFSIDQGFHLLAKFNQNPDGDFGDWDSDGFCPATRLYVQNAFNCAGQSTDISATSPEGISLDVIGYDLVSAPVANADIIWQNTSTGQRVIWLMNGITFQSFVNLGTVGTSWSIAGSGDFNGDGKADILWQNSFTGQRVIWFMNGTAFQSFVSFGNYKIHSGASLVRRLQRGRQIGHYLGKHLYWPARYLAHEWHRASILCQFRNGGDIVEHRWFRRFQRGRQGGHSLAKHLYWRALNLAYEWHRASIQCQFPNDGSTVEHRWFRRLQRGRQIGHSLAKHRYRPARYLAHECTTFQSFVSFATVDPSWSIRNH